MANGNMGLADMLALYGPEGAQAFMMNDPKYQKLQSLTALMTAYANGQGVPPPELVKAYVEASGGMVPAAVDPAASPAAQPGTAPSRPAFVGLSHAARARIEAMKNSSDPEERRLCEQWHQANERANRPQDWVSNAFEGWSPSPLGTGLW
jgi:hypothetical protein